MICKYCHKNIVHHGHHKFSKTNLTRKLYKDYIDDKRNIDYICYDCHQWKPIVKYSEKEFCEIMGIKIRSKTGLL